MTQQRIAVKEQRRLLPDQKLYASKSFWQHLWTLVTFEKTCLVKKKTIHTRNGFLLTDFFGKKIKLCLVQPGPNSIAVFTITDPSCPWLMLTLVTATMKKEWFPFSTQGATFWEKGRKWKCQHKTTSLSFIFLDFSSHCRPLQFYKVWPQTIRW